MQKKRLIDLIADKISGEWGIDLKGKKQGVNVIRSTNFENDGNINYEKVIIRDIPISKVKKKKLQKGDVIIEKSGGSPKQPVGRVVHYSNNSNENYLCNNFTSILRPNKLVQPKYLFYALYYLHLSGKTLKYQNKTTGIINLKLDKYLENEEVYLPSIAEQNNIVTILDKAVDLRGMRKESIQLLDEFLKSTFVEMFGDPVSNEKGWNIVKLNEICRKITDGTHDTPDRIKTGIKYITGKHIRPFQIDFIHSDYVSAEDHKEIYKRCNPEKGDILYTNIGVNLGTAAMNSVDYEFSMKNVALLKLDLNRALPRYIEFILNNEQMKKEILRLSSIGGAQKFLGLQDIKNINIPLPNIDKQIEFVQITDYTFNIKSIMNDSYYVINNQFNALMQRWFG